MYDANYSLCVDVSGRNENLCTMTPFWRTGGGGGVTESFLKLGSFSQVLVSQQDGTKSVEQSGKTAIKTMCSPVLSPTINNVIILFYSSVLSFLSLSPRRTVAASDTES